jgi:hypothetical protein
MAQTTHAIIGTGETSEKALHESLKDALEDGDSVSIIWSGKPNETVEALYDYILDHEIEFTMFYTDEAHPPKVFRTADTGVTQKSRNPIVAAAKSVANRGKVLLLWDDDEQDDYVNAHDAAPDGTLFMELSNGLTPVSFEDPAEGLPDIEEPEVEEEDDEEVSFTREELLNMPAATVKRYGAKAGCKAATKTGIIEELFPEGEEEPEVEEEAPAPKSSTLDVLDSVKFKKDSNEEDTWAYLRSRHGGTDIDNAGLLFCSVLLSTLPFGKERASAITKVQEAMLWAETAPLGDD